MKSEIRIILEILFCALILLFLISKIHIRETIEILRTVDLFWISIGLIVYLIALVITAYSLKALFDSIKHTPLMEWMRFYLVGFSMGLILPGRAGDLSIIYFAKQKGFDIGASTALTITDKLIIFIIFLRPVGNALLIILIFKAMGIDVSFLYAILINAVTLIVSLVPLTPNGLGIREAVGTFLFSRVGVPIEATVAMYIIILMMNYTTGIIGTGVYLFHDGRQKSSKS